MALRGPSRQPLSPLFLLLLLLLLLPWRCPGAEPAHPEQVHLSFQGEPGSMTVTWTTWVATDSEVQFGLEPGEILPARVRGTCSPFVDGGILRRTLFMHRVVLRGLTPGVRYAYRCGSIRGWSRRFRFVALRPGPDWSPRLAVFGDMGADNPQALPRLRGDTQRGLYDAVLHVGDFAYNMDQDNARVGDRFMRLIEPVAATLPYMTCPGNHEERYNFSNYKARFNMPGDTEGLWYRTHCPPTPDLRPLPFLHEAGTWVPPTSSPSPRRFTSSSTMAATWSRSSFAGWRGTCRKPTRTGRRGPGSSPWATGPCTAPTPTWTTAPCTRARSAEVSSASATAWRIFSTNTGSTWSCGLTNIPMSGSGPSTTTRCTMAVEKLRTPTPTPPSTSSPDLPAVRSC
ncbi:acid phosphatase type 7 isoform X2 [Ornithorhynchus anatinus]|uniref:acid phosphatase type 7 isoform X2 n=1 Tax=Ornithorhynchus anatinus TaxID=9258 RepID=UPI0019D4C700|nr:acid phosphatase type 7 isoform X2 [Ornithorhynchus anatinus]